MWPMFVLRRKVWEIGAFILRNLKLQTASFSLADSSKMFYYWNRKQNNTQICPKENAN